MAFIEKQKLVIISAAEYEIDQGVRDDLQAQVNAGLDRERFLRDEIKTVESKRDNAIADRDSANAFAQSMGDERDKARSELHAVIKDRDNFRKAFNEAQSERDRLRAKINSPERVALRTEWIASIERDRDKALAELEIAKEANNADAFTSVLRDWAVDREKLDAEKVARKQVVEWLEASRLDLLGMTEARDRAAKRVNALERELAAKVDEHAKFNKLADEAAARRVKRAEDAAVAELNALKAMLGAAAREILESLSE